VFHRVRSACERRAVLAHSRFSSYVHAALSLPRFHGDMEPSGSRIAAARARAATAKNTLLAAALALFLAAMVAVRLSQPARASQPTSSSTSTSDDTFQDDGYFDSGSVALREKALDPTRLGRGEDGRRRARADLPRRFRLRRRRSRGALDVALPTATRYAWSSAVSRRAAARSGAGFAAAAGSTI
jgi:hypothetical protein